MIIAGSCVVAVVFFIVGFAVQDWSCTSNCGTGTGGSNDATWGTYVTDYVLAIELFIMAVMAPGTGMAKHVLTAGFVVSAVGWLYGGILHQLFFEPGTVHDFLWTTSLMTSIIACVLRLLAAIMLAQLADRCPCCKDSKILSIVFGVVAFSFSVTVVLSVYVANFPLAGWMVVAIINIPFNVAVMVVGYVAREPLWATACLLSFVMYLVLNQVKFEPFVSSDQFNDNGLFHSALMVYVAMAFGLFNSLAGLAEGPAHSALIAMPE